jgi:uncharacterized protein
MPSCCEHARSMDSKTLEISVVYALPDRQVSARLRVMEGTTIERAIELSRLADQFPDIRSRALHCAVFGRVTPLTQFVRAGDRIEILRPLLIDPKESRRQAAGRGKRGH